MARILMYEDSESWKESFVNLPKLRHLNLTNPRFFMHRDKADTVMQDLEYLADIILVDNDLGEYTSEDVISQIDQDPQYSSTSIVLYSGGDTIDLLEAIKSKYLCNIICCMKDDLEETLLELAKRF